MPSKSKQQQMNIAFNRYLSQHPEIKKQFTVEKTLHAVECGLLVAVDYMCRYKEMTSKELDEFFEHCRKQFFAIDYDKWEDYFTDMNSALEEEYNAGVLEKVLRRH